MKTAILLLMVISLGLLSLPAHAFTPQPGARAYPIEGRDIVSGEQISLEAMRGKWVLLEFWASW